MDWIWPVIRKPLFFGRERKEQGRGIKVGERREGLRDFFTGIIWGFPLKTILVREINLFKFGGADYSLKERPGF